MTYLEKKLQEFDEKFVKTRMCKCCLKEKCEHSTTGCPWYEDNMVFSESGDQQLLPKQIKSFITNLLHAERDKGYAGGFDAGGHTVGETGRTMYERGRAEERERIAKICEEMKHTPINCDCDTACLYNQALSSLRDKL